MDDVYEKIDDYNPHRQRKILIVSDDVTADVMTNKKFGAIIKELFIRCRKLNISLVFITQSYSFVRKVFRLNSTYYLIMKFLTCFAQLLIIRQDCSNYVPVEFQTDERDIHLAKSFLVFFWSTLQ